MVRNRVRALTSRKSSDSGLTIVELVVAMGIFTIVLAIFFSALASMSHTTAAAQETVDASDALRKTFNSLDHQVRYASSINRPGKGASGSYYVEFETTDLPSDQAPMCYQWRYNPTQETLAFRTWIEDGSSTVGAWQGVAWDVQSDGGLSPFSFSPATGSALRQALVVALTVDGSQIAVVADQATRFVARNSSTSSPSNVDANADGASDTPVCLTGMSRP